MRSEFDTLEQYQESMKEFNENTRMGFEEFIQSHGSDRNKLQLRCTPYTSKKGGYGSFDLDFGLCVYQHQQSKVDELQKQRDSFIKAYEIEIDKSDDLQKRVDAAKQLIEDLNECYQQDHQNKFEYWRGFADSAGILGKRLEQALNGGGE